VEIKTSFGEEEKEELVHSKADWVWVLSLSLWEKDVGCPYLINYEDTKPKAERPL
jgi:hypothetical protein